MEEYILTLLPPEVIKQEENYLLTILPPSLGVKVAKA